MKKIKTEYGTEEYIAGVWLDNKFLVGVGSNKIIRDGMQYRVEATEEFYKKDLEAELYLNFISFACSLPTGNTVSEATLVIRDSSMEYLENLLINSPSKCMNIWYGRVKSDTEIGKMNSDVIFRELYLKIINYKVEIKNSYSLLTIELVDDSVGKRESKVTESLGTKYPHEAFIKICEKMGWKYTTYASKPVNDFINIGGVSYNQFINMELTKIAVSVDGDADYRFWLVDKSGFKFGVYTKDVHAFFLPSKRITGKDIKAEYSAGVYSSQDVISFTAEYEGAQLLNYGSTTELRGLAMDTKLPVIMKRTLNSRAVTTNEMVRDDFNLNAVSIIPRSVESLSEAEIKVYASWIMGQRALYKGKLEVKGNSSLNVGDTIYILVMTPMGNPHHSTGKYMINSVVENLNDSGYVSQFELIKILDDEVVKEREGEE